MGEGNKGSERLQPTPNDSGIPLVPGRSNTLTAALDYAATGATGFNFHDSRANLVDVCTYRELREGALDQAQILIAAGIGAGERVALIAETGPAFAKLFFGCLYAGALPVPLPLPTSFGQREAYIQQIHVQLESADPVYIVGPADLFPLFSEAAKGVTEAKTWEEFAAMPRAGVTLPDIDPKATAYLQYSSGSTRFPHGVAITHEAAMANMTGHAIAMKVQPGERVISWLPWYHDMGLVGCMLSPLASQISVDYLATNDFARRPMSWLTLISRNQSTSISYSPTFGYDLCARRMATHQDGIGTRFDLSRWRIAGNGADMIRPDICQAFVNTFAAAGFRASAFTPSYGLAEATLAVTIAPPGQGIVCDLVDEELLADKGVAERTAAPCTVSHGANSHEINGQARPKRYRAIVDCGPVIEGLSIDIRNADGQSLPERHVGRVLVKGLGVMEGYFRNPEATALCLSDDGWLDTGDMGYVANSHLFIVGRIKDMIILNGRNHWPQDIEWAIEQLEGFKAGDIAAFAITTPSGEEAPAVLVHCRTSDPAERARLKQVIQAKVRAITGMSCIVELVPPRSLPRTSSGKLSRVKARELYLSGTIVPIEVEAA